MGVECMLRNGALRGCCCDLATARVIRNLEGKSAITFLGDFSLKKHLISQRKLRYAMKSPNS